MKYLRVFDTLSQALSDTNYEKCAVVCCKDTEGIMTLEAPADTSTGTRTVIALDANDKFVLYDLAKALKEDLGYNDAEVDGAYKAINQFGTFHIAEIAAAKALKDSWDPTTTSINSRWRDGGVGYFFPKLDFGEVTDAYKAFHGNYTIKFFPEMHLPKCTNVEGMWWYDNTNPMVLTLDTWEGVPSYGSQYIMYLSSILLPMTINAPEATKINYFMPSTDIYAETVWNIDKVTSMTMPGANIYAPITINSTGLTSFTQTITGYDITLNTPNLTSLSYSYASVINEPLTINLPKLTVLEMPLAGTINAEVNINTPSLESFTINNSIVNSPITLNASSALNTVSFRGELNAKVTVNCPGELTDLTNLFLLSTVNVIPDISISSAPTSLSYTFYDTSINLNGEDILEAFNITDTSACTDFSYCFGEASTQKTYNYTIDLSKINISSATTVAHMFIRLQILQTLPSYSSSTVLNFNGFARGCDNTTSPVITTGITTITTIGDLLFPNATSCDSLFTGNDSLVTVGDIDCSSIESIPLNYTVPSKYYTFYRYNAFYKTLSLTNLGRLINLGQSFVPYTEDTPANNGLDFSESPLLTHESLMNVFNSIATIPVQGMTAIIKLGTTNLAKLTADEIKIATDKGWTVEE